MIYIINFSFYIISHKKKIKRKLIILNSPHLFIIIINNNIGVCYYCVNITMKCGIHETITYYTCLYVNERTSQWHASSN